MDPNETVRDTGTDGENLEEITEQSCRSREIQVRGFLKAQALGSIPGEPLYKFTRGTSKRRPSVGCSGISKYLYYEYV